MKMYLVGNDLWKIVDGSEKHPPEIDNERRTKFKKHANLAMVATNLGSD